MNQTIKIGTNSRSVMLSDLEQAAHQFFKSSGTRSLLGSDVFFAAGIKRPVLLFEDLLAACRYANAPQDFFQSLLDKIFVKKEQPITINKIPIPVIFLTYLLESVMAGDRLHQIEQPEQIETLGVAAAPEEKEQIAEVINQYPVRLSDHVLRQAMVSKNVARQYLPFADELDTIGAPITFEGHLRQGVLEQMYENRVIFLLDMQCPVFCRFCFRKHKELRREKPPGKSDVLAAVDHVARHPAIREILITGGEPLLNRPNLDTALAGLAAVSHVDVIRIATRSVSYYPRLFLKNNKSLIRYLAAENRTMREAGKRIEIGVHFVHPDEVSLQSLEIITEFVKNGIQVYVQTPFLNGLNTDGKDLGRLFSLLRNAGAKIYYIFAPCSPIHGTRPFWAPISTAMAATDYLRQHVSDRSIPKLCTATPLGKIEWGTSGWAVEKDVRDPDYIWIRTPYTKAYYQQFINDEKDMPVFRENRDGTLDARFRVDMGDEALFFGGRSKRKREGHPTVRRREDHYLKVRSALCRQHPLRSSVAKVPCKTISQVHPAVLEMKISAGNSAFCYLEKNDNITDVILHPDAAELRRPEIIADVIGRIRKSDHVTCVRVCCPQFNTNPDVISSALVDVLAGCMDFSIARPFRVEIETWFLHSPEVTKGHARLAHKLVDKGILIYANVSLMEGVNDDPGTMTALAHALRHAGIEFHHLYAAGLRIQERFNTKSMPDPDLLIDMASMIRSACSGRQIPLYVVQTPDGEVPVRVI